MGIAHFFAYETTKVREFTELFSIQSIKNIIISFYLQYVIQSF